MTKNKMVKTVADLVKYLRKSLFHPLSEFPVFDTKEIPIVFYDSSEHKFIKCNGYRMASIVLDHSENWLILTDFDMDEDQEKFSELNSEILKRFSSESGNQNTSNN